MSERLTEVRIRSEDRPEEVLSIGRPTGGADGFWYVSIKLEADGLSCTRGGTMYRDDGIRAFFAEMAADWRGWPGTRSWHTLEQDLIVRATHAGRRIELVCTLQRDNYDDAWQVNLTMLLPPDESLNRLAADIAELFEDV